MRFIGTFKCELCQKRVRIYDWFPACILCAKCAREIEKQEANATELTDETSNDHKP